jgi:dihydropyrimidinase
MAWMTENYDLIVAGGTIVTGQGIQSCDVAVKDGKIAGVGKKLDRNGCREIVDATGKLVFPGIIDVHVHPVYLDDVEGSSLVAAYGGTTTLLHFAYARQGESLEQKVSEMLADGLRRSRLDFGLHGGLFDAENQVPEISAVMQMGVRTFKFFLAYLKLGWYTDDYQLTKAMDILASQGGMAMVHAENGGGTDYLEDKYLKGPHASASYFNTSHPDILEEEAIFRSICLAEVTGCPLYIPHVTSRRGLRPIRRAQAEGLRVFAETCPQYLTLTEQIIEERGTLAKIGPPIRSQVDQQSLWKALQDGTLQVVASDHAPKKKDPKGDFLSQSFGSPSIETLLTVTYDWGINRGLINLVRLAQVLCENPARIFGLYPQKGTLQPGSDADLVIFDPCREYTIQAENQHSQAGYTLYEGRQVLGWPEATFQRGNPVLRNGNIIAQPGTGCFLPTHPAGMDPA